MRALAKWASALCRCSPWLLVGSLAGCGDPLYLGSDLIWSARLEDGNLAEWNGGTQPFPAPRDAANVRVSDARARSGRYSLSVTRPPTATERGPVIGHSP